MVPYISLSLFVLFCWFLYCRGILNSKGYRVAVFIPSALLLALRSSNVGEDTAMYLQMANASAFLPWKSLSPFGSAIMWNANALGFGSSVDPGFLLLLKILMCLFGSAEMAIGFCAILTCLLFAVFLYHNSDNIPQAFWGFMCGGLYMFAFNGVRQMLALSIACNFYQSAKKEQWLRSILLIVLGSCFHRSAIALFGIFAALYLLKFKRFYPIAMISAALMPLLVNIAFPLVRLISPQFASYYAVNYWSAQTGGILLIWLLVLFCSLLLLFKRNDEVSHRFFSFCDAAYLGLSVASLRISIIERVALYAMPFVCLSLEKVLALFPEKSRWIIALFVNGLLFALFVSYAMSPTRCYSPCF